MGYENEKWLKKQVDSWTQAGIIDLPQAGEILSLYKIDEKKEEITKESIKENRVIVVLATLGSILIGLGTIVFVASNWQILPNVVKLFVLFSATFSTYFIGWKMKNTNYPLIGQSLLFLGSLFVGATLFLTAQIFNVQANAHWIILLWFIAVAPLSYGFNSKPTLILSLMIFALWIITYVNTAYLGVLLFYGITLIGVGYFHEIVGSINYKGSYQGFGLFFTLATIYYILASELYLVNELRNHWLALTFLVSAFTTTIISGFLFRESIGNKQEFLWNLLALITAFGMWKYSMLGKSIMSYLHWPALITFNILFFILVITTIIWGYYKKIAFLINLGLVFFVLHIGYLYFTTIFKYLPKSAALIIGGVILIWGGFYLEKTRRSIMGEIKSEDNG